MDGHPPGPPPCQSPTCSEPTIATTSYTYCRAHDPGLCVPEHRGELTTEGIAIDGSKAVTGTDDFTFYFGASCGSSRKTLRQLEEPNVCLSYATKNNVPWDSIDSLMVDSGGYSLLRAGGGTYDDDLGEYLDFVEQHNAEWFMARDVPVTDKLLSNTGYTKGKALSRSVEYTIETLEAAHARGVDANILAVLQGTTPEEYVRCYDELLDYGIVTGRLAIGSLVEKSTAEAQAIITTVDDAVADWVELHGLGVGPDTLADERVQSALSSADSSRYIATARWRGNRDEHPPRLRTDEPQAGWLECARAYLDMRTELREVLTVAGTREPPENSTQLTLDVGQTQT